MASWSESVTIVNQRLRASGDSPESTRRLQIDPFTRRLPVTTQIKFVANSKRNSLALSRRHILLHQRRLQSSTTCLGKRYQPSDLNPHRRRRSRLRLKDLGHRPTQLPLGSTLMRIDGRNQLRLQIRSEQLPAAQQDNASKRHRTSDRPPRHRR